MSSRINRLPLAVSSHPVHVWAVHTIVLAGGRGKGKSSLFGKGMQIHSLFPRTHYRMPGTWAWDEIFLLNEKAAGPSLHKPRHSAAL